jgi:hypothetical protein
MEVPSKSLWRVRLDQMAARASSSAYRIRAIRCRVLDEPVVKQRPRISIMDDETS